MAVPAVQLSPVSKSTVTAVASSATNVTLLAANRLRLGATIYNDSTAVLYVKCGSTAVIASSFTMQMASETFFEIPAGYTGVVDGIWASANGNAMVTEFTA